MKIVLHFNFLSFLSCYYSGTKTAITLTTSEKLEVSFELPAATSNLQQTFITTAEKMPVATIRWI
jgi:hypothetical protein